MADDDEQVRNYISKLVKEEIGKHATEAGGRGGGRSDVDLGEFGKFVSAAKGMKEAMTSDVDKALSQAVSTKIVDQVLPSMSSQPKTGTGFYDSNAAIAFFQKLPEQLVPLADTVFTRLGQEKAGRLVDGVTNYLSGKGGGGVTKRTDADIIGSLDPDNPSHLHYYMSIRNMGSIDANAARNGLIMEKENLKKGIPATPIPSDTPGFAQPPTPDTMAGSGLENAIREQNEFIKQIINKQNENEQFMKFLYEKVEKIEHPVKQRIDIDKPRVDINSINDRGNDGLGEKDKNIIGNQAKNEVKNDIISPKIDDIVKTKEEVKSKDAITKKEDITNTKEEVEEESDAVVEVMKKGDTEIPVFE